MGNKVEKPRTFHLNENSREPGASFNLNQYLSVNEQYSLRCRIASTKIQNTLPHLAIDEVPAHILFNSVTPSFRHSLG